MLREAIEPVLRDLRVAGITTPRIEDRDWMGDPDSASVMLWSPVGSGMGVHVSRTVPPHDRVAMLTDQVQEWAIEELWGRGPTNWPPCPRHRDNHPLSASARDGVAVWVCPSDGHLIAPVGAL